MNLIHGIVGKEYIVKDILVDDEELRVFLLTLGCYPGEKVTIIAIKKKNIVISIKNARYNIDSQLANLILVD